MAISDAKTKTAKAIFFIASSYPFFSALGRKRHTEQPNSLRPQTLPRTKTYEVRGTRTEYTR